MWQPNNITIKNLITHENTFFEFKKNKCVMIFGVNSTDIGSDSNGGGKSTILEGITLSITGETNRGVNKDEFIRDGEEECFIEMNMSNEIGEVKKLAIKRWFHRKKSNKIEIWENGEQNKELSSVNEANARIFELIGLSKEDLLHFFMIGQETNYSFLTSNDIDKKNIISRFSEVDYINNKIETLKSNRKNLDFELDNLSKNRQKIENKIEFLNDSKEEILQNFDSRNKEKINKQKNNISTYEQSLQKIKSDKKDSSDRLKNIEEQISKITLKEDSDLNNSLSENLSNQKKVNKEIIEAESFISHLEAIQEGKIICPKCQHPFNPSEEMELSEIPVLIESTNVLLSEKYRLKNKIQKSVDSKRKEIQDNISESDKLNSLKRNLKKCRENITNYKEELEQFQSKIQICLEQIEILKSNSSDSEIAKIDIQIQEQEKNLKTFDSQKSEIDKKILDIDFWIHHLGKKGFLTFLTNKSIKSIEGITNSYLKKMNSELQVLIDGYTVLKSGDVREKINISIIRSGLELGNFNRYSGGEKGRIKLANILGLQHLINLTAKNGGLNFLGLDEVFEGLDKTGQIDVLSILERLNVTSLVITHRNQPIGAKNEIFIEKINGVSRIIKK